MSWLRAIPSLLRRIPWHAYAALAVLLAGWHLHHRGYEAGRTHAEAIWADLLAKAATDTAAREAASKATLKESERHASELQTNLDDYRRDHPARAVRLCPSPPAASVPATAADPSGPDAVGASDVPTGSGPAAGSGGSAEIDLGPALYAAADRADACAVTIARWQGYARSLEAAWPGTIRPATQ